MPLPDISAFYDTDENALAAHLEWIFEDNYHRQLEFLQPRFDQDKLMTVTEYGPGSGLLAHAFKQTCPRLGYIGVEKSGRLCDLARSRRVYRGDYDVLTFHNGDGRRFSEPCDVAVAFGFLKHFDLGEWDAILTHVLGQGRFACFDMQILGHDLDNGSIYPHVFVTPERLNHVIHEAYHEIVEQQVWAESDLNGHGRMQRVALWTRRG